MPDEYPTIETQESADDVKDLPAWRIGDAVLDQAGLVWQHVGYGWKCPGRTDWTSGEGFGPLTVLVKDGKAVGHDQP